MSGSNLLNDSSPQTARDVDAAASAQDHPLGLTVHSLPVPEQSMADDAARVVQGRWRLALLMLVCAAPVIASYFTYYVVRPDARRNFGELIQPQRPVSELAGATLDGQPVSLSTLKGQWLLVSVSAARVALRASSSSTCNANCARAWARKKNASIASGSSTMRKPCQPRCKRA